MGLFDSLKKNIGGVINEIDKHTDDIQREFDKHADNLQREFNKFTEKNGNAQYTEPAAEPAAAPVNLTVNKNAPDCFDKFDVIISRNFADCEVRRNVPAAELKPGCHPACTPIQFLFFKNSEPVLAVVLVRTNNYRGRNVVATKDICAEKGIKYIRFYHEYENEESYVVNRIKENLQ